MFTKQSTILLQAHSLILVAALVNIVSAFVPSISSGNVHRRHFGATRVSHPSQSLFLPIIGDPKCRWHDSPTSPFSSATSLAFTLTTALESLAEDRYNNTDDDTGDEGNSSSINSAYYKHIRWIDPKAEIQEDPHLGGDDDQTDNDDDSSPTSSSSSSRTVPLYPLSELHLPATGTNHTLINTEPRNIQMALDLIQQNEDSNGRDNNMILGRY